MLPPLPFPPLQNYTLTPSNAVRVALEVLYLCALLWNMVEEALQALRCKCTTGRALDYFQDPWNWLDLASISLQLTGVGLWYVARLVLLPRPYSWPAL